MPTSSINIVADQGDSSVIVDPTVTYRPEPVKGTRYIVRAESPKRPEGK